MNLESNFRDKFNEQQKKHLDIFEEKFPLIKFPEDLKVTKKNGLANFVVEKEDAPNTVSVIVYTGATVDDNLDPQWEVVSVDKSNKFNDDFVQHISIDDTDDLIKAIEESLSHVPSHEDYVTKEPEEESLEFNPSRYRENEFRTEYAEILTQASSDKEKNREIIKDIIEMERLVNDYYYISEHETHPNLNPDYIDELNALRQKYNLPKLYIVNWDDLSQFENK